jgi:hypothetical protein
MDGAPFHFDHIQGIKLLYLTEIGGEILKWLDIVM